jgi:hypothetical protein
MDDQVTLEVSNLRALPLDLASFNFLFQRGRVEISEHDGAWTIYDDTAHSAQRISMEYPNRSPYTRTMLLDYALSDLLAGRNNESYEFGGKAVEAIIAAQLSSQEGKTKELPLKPDVPTPFPFS